MRIQRSHATCLIMTLAVGANAQAGGKTFQAGVGWNYLSDKGSSDATRSSGFQALLGYHFPSTLFAEGSNIDPSIDLNWSRNSGNGNRLDVYSAQVVVRYPLGYGGQNATGLYLGYGIGAAEDQFVSGTTTTATLKHPGRGISSGSASDSKVNLSTKILLGMNLSKSLFAEAAYTYSGSLEGTTLTGISALVGIRF